MDFSQNLVTRGLITAMTAEMLERYMKKWQKSFVHALLECHIMSESTLAEALSEFYKLNRVDTIDQKRSSQVLAYIPFELAVAHDCLPLEMQEDNTLKVATADPGKEELRKFLAQADFKCEVVVSEFSLLQRSILDFYEVSRCIPSLASP